MKNSQMLVLFGLFFCSFLQIPSSNAAFSKTDPIYNVNLAPFIQRLSAYYCLHNNISSDCPGNFTLSEKGWLNISESDTRAFCDGGCFQHTQEVLECVRYVKEDYTFENGATIQNIKDTIKFGCSEGFNGTSLYNSGTATSVSITLSALAFLALFYM